MSVYYEGQQKHLFIGKGGMLMDATHYRMWVDSPTIAMAGSSGYGLIYEPNSHCLLDWVQSRGLYPTSSSTYDIAYFKKDGTLFNLNNYDYTGASHTSVALTSLPNNVLAFRGSVRPWLPWENTIMSNYLPNHGNSSDYRNVSPAYIGFSRRAVDSDQDYYIGDYSSVEITQKLLISTPADATPIVNNTIFAATNKNTIGFPLMFFGLSPEDYIQPMQYINSNPTMQFIVPSNSETAIATKYTLFENTTTYNFSQYSSASVGPFIVVAAPGYSYGSSGIIDGTSGSTATIVRATLGYSFF